MKVHLLKRLFGNVQMEIHMKKPYSTFTVNLRYLRHISRIELTPYVYAPQSWSVHDQESCLEDSAVIKLMHVKALGISKGH